MSINPSKAKQAKETRGRPKKNQVKELSSEYRHTFTENMCVTYGLALMYVMEIFAQTKEEKRIGHSEGSFTVYEKIEEKYSFDTFHKDLQNWKFKHILNNKQMYNMAKTLVGIAPTFVLRQLTLIIEEYLQQLQKHGSSKGALNELRKSYYQSQPDAHSHLNNKFKYLRFSREALTQLKSEKWNDLISKKVKQLWPIFIDIFSYCLYCTSENIVTNKFLKPLFSDAANPQNTLIGQLTLQQIINQTDREDFEEYIKRPENPGQSFTRYKGGMDSLISSNRGFPSEKSIFPDQENTPKVNKPASEQSIIGSAAQLPTRITDSKKVATIIVKQPQPIREGSRSLSSQLSLTSILYPTKTDEQYFRKRRESLDRQRKPVNQENDQINLEFQIMDIQMNNRRNDEENSIEEEEEVPQQLRDVYKEDGKEDYKHSLNDTMNAESVGDQRKILKVIDIKADHGVQAAVDRAQKLDNQNDKIPTRQCLKGIDDEEPLDHGQDKRGPKNVNKVEGPTWPESDEEQVSPNINEDSEKSNQKRDNRPTGTSQKQANQIYEKIRKQICK